MLQLKRIFKSIFKYRTASLLTLLSLVISFTGVIILSLYVSYEKSFDNFHKNGKLIYRLETRGTDFGSWLPAPIAPISQQNIPEIKAVTRLQILGDYISTPDLQKTKFEIETYFADSTFFQIFSFPLILGNKSTVLTNDHSAVISQSLSNKLFGDKNPIGQVVTFENVNFTVSGVMKNFPKNSSFQADCIFPFFIYESEKNYAYLNDWSQSSFNTIILLNKNADPKEIAKKIGQIQVVKQQMAEDESKYKGKDSFLFLNPIHKLHYMNDGFLEGQTNPVVLNVLTLLIIILIIMGAVNFINFSTSQAPLRTKSLAINRVLGGKRISSALQIVTESILLSFTALILSLIIYRLSYHYLESLFSIQGLGLNGRYYFIFLFVLFAFVFGILAGLYPAKYISSPTIAQTLKGSIHFSGKGKLIRNSLIVLQFIIVIALTASSLVIEKQLNFWQHFDIGINTDHVVYLKTSKKIAQHSNAFAQELLRNQTIKNYTYSQFIPGKIQLQWAQEVDGQYISFYCWPIDNRFLDFFGIKIEQGRKFSSDQQNDLNSFIFNQKAAAQFGWTQPLTHKLGDFNIVGIVKDFNFSSLKSQVAPMAFWRTQSRKDYLLLRLSPGNYTQTIKFIKQTAHQFDPESHFEIKFLNDSLNQLYSKDKRIALFIEFITLWTILLALTGLLGLIIFISHDRIKEIGIRKVNGARVSEVVTMLNKDLLKWVLLAFIIAGPIAWYAMQKWLQNFAYKTTLSWWIFLIAGLFALLIAFLTVSWESWRAATKNPVEALHYE